MNSARSIGVFNDYPASGVIHGGRQKILQLYRRLASRYPIRYVCTHRRPEASPIAIAPGFTQVTIPITWHERRLRHFLGARLGTSVDDIASLCVARNNGNLAREISKTIAQVDAVVLSHPYLWPAVRPHLENCSKPVIYDSQNCEWRLKAGMFKAGWVSRRVLRRLHDVEADLVARADSVWAVSEDDARVFVSEYGAAPAKLFVVANGAEAGFFPARSNWNAMRAQAIFLGGGHAPNVDAAEFIVESLARQCPDVDFVFCGDVGAKLLNRSLPPNVAILGTVSDSAKITALMNATIALNPVSVGSGTNVKMLDYFAAALPVITTPTGARGLRVESGKQALVCDREDFASALRQLAGDVETRRSLGAAARRLVEQHYDWAAIAQTLEPVLEALMTRTSHRH